MLRKILKITIFLILNLLNYFNIIAEKTIPKAKSCLRGACKSCYATTYKPLWCDKSINQPSADHHVPESMGPHGYNYDGLPWYLDDGYSHYNSFW